jgi:tetratricopeptide (TPR) repeat protein
MASLEAVGDTYYSQGDTENSICYFEQVVEILTANFGAGDVEVGKFLAKIALLYQYQHKHEVAKSLFDRALIILRKELGDKHQLTEETVRRLITLRKIMAI